MTANKRVHGTQGIEQWVGRCPVGWGAPGGDGGDCRKIVSVLLMERALTIAAENHDHDHE